jgi:hypothetical protein
MEPERSLPCSQKPATGPYPTLDAASPHPVSCHIGGQRNGNDDLIRIFKERVTFYSKELAQHLSERIQPMKTNSLIRRCIQKFPDWPPGARTANGTALCH